MELLLQGLGEGREGEARQALHMLEEWQAVADRDGLVAGPDDEQQHLVGQGDDRQLGYSAADIGTLRRRYLDIPVPNSSVFHTIAWLRHFGGQPWISCASPSPGWPVRHICNQSPCACCRNQRPRSLRSFRDGRSTHGPRFRPGKLLHTPTAPLPGG